MKSKLNKQIFHRLRKNNTQSAKLTPLLLRGIETPQKFPSGRGVVEDWGVVISTNLDLTNKW